jgi:hypothetical protein
MLAETVDCAFAGFELTTEVARESKLPLHNGGAARRVSERIESCFHAQNKFL